MKHIYSLKIIVMFTVCCLSASYLWGWGSGHDYVNKNALTVMPDEIKSFLGVDNQKNFIRWSHAPDNHSSLEDEQKRYPIADIEIAYMKSFGAKSLYALHSHRQPGQGGNFVLLIRAFMDKDPERSAFWMSTIMHTVADDVACNHTSHIHYLTYGFKAYNIKIGNGVGTDYSDIAKTSIGEKAINSLLREYQPKIIQGTPGEVLNKILLANAHAATYGTIREYKIVATYAPGVTVEAREDGVKAMAELGVYGVKNGVDIIATAWEFAKAGKVPVLTPEAIKEAGEERKEYFASRPLTDDSIYRGLLL